MKSVAASLFLAIAVAGALGRTTGQARTFTSPGGRFRFTYASDFQVCTKGNIEPCNEFTYLPICDKNALVCVLYPQGQFRDTTFEGAAFEVDEILRDGKPPETADECVTPYGEEYLISAEHPIEVIGGISFIHGWTVGALMGNVNRVEIYRAFHKGHCFELSITEAQANLDPGVSEKKALTPAQKQQVERNMSEILQSFRFDQ